MEFLFSVLLIWSLAAMSPGPNLFLIMRYSLIGQRKEALAAAFGIATGTFVWGIAGWLGIVALFKTLPDLFFAIKMIGAVYLVWTGSKMLLAAWRNNYNQSAVVGDTSKSPLQAYRAGRSPIFLIPRQQFLSLRYLQPRCLSSRRSCLVWPAPY